MNKFCVDFQMNFQQKSTYQLKKKVFLQKKIAISPTALGVKLSGYTKKKKKTTKENRRKEYQKIRQENLY